MIARNLVSTGAIYAGFGRAALRKPTDDQMRRPSVRQHEARYQVTVQPGTQTRPDPNPGLRSQGAVISQQWRDERVRVGRVMCPGVLIGCGLGLAEPWRSRPVGVLGFLGEDGGH